jgi:hypothetical protein
MEACIFKPDKHFYKTLLLHYKNKQVVRFSLYVDHDGYDMYGPKSNLYKLIVYYFDTNSIVKKDWWHREYWFFGKDDEPFVLIKENISEPLRRPCQTVYSFWSIKEIVIKVQAIWRGRSTRMKIELFQCQPDVRFRTHENEAAWIQKDVEENE